MAKTEARATAISDKVVAFPVHDRGWTPFWTFPDSPKGPDKMDTLFNDFFRTGWAGRSPDRHRGDASVMRRPAMVPRIDIIEKEKEVKLIADLSGLTEEDVDVQVADNALTIRGEKKDEIDEDDKESERYASERRFGSFVRRIPLPDDINHDQIDVTFKNGVLTVHLPKVPEA